MARLQKRFAYKYSAKDGERIHYKYLVTIPEEIVRRLGWRGGDEIIQSVTQSGLTLTRKEKKKEGKDGSSGTRSTQV